MLTVPNALDRGLTPCVRASRQELIKIKKNCESKISNKKFPKFLINKGSKISLVNPPEKLEKAMEESSKYKNAADLQSDQLERTVGYSVQFSKLSERDNQGQSMVRADNDKPSSNISINGAYILEFSQRNAEFIENVIEDLLKDEGHGAYDAKNALKELGANCSGVESYGVRDEDKRIAEQIKDCILNYNTDLLEMSDTEKAMLSNAIFNKAIEYVLEKLHIDGDPIEYVGRSNQR